MKRFESHSLEDFADARWTMPETHGILKEYELFGPNTTREDVNGMSSKETLQLDPGYHHAMGENFVIPYVDVDRSGNVYQGEDWGEFPVDRGDFVLTKVDEHSSKGNAGV